MRRRNVDVASVGVVAVLGWASLLGGMPAQLVVAVGLALFAAPGYVWSEVLLARRATGLERSVVSVGIALVVPILGGLALYAAGISLHRAAWVGLLSAVTIAGAAVLAIQRRRSEAPAADTQVSKGALPLRALLVFGAATVIATGSVTLAVLSADAQKYPGYTQLWMSPVENSAIEANLGITNQQGSTLAYRLVLLRKGKVSASWNLTLTSGQSWVRIIPYTTKYSIVADLYHMPNLRQPYRRVDNGG